MSGIHFIGGSEPYSVDCQKISLVGKLNVKELNYIEAECFSEEVYQFLFTLPFGDDRKVAYVVVADLSEMNTPLFNEYIKAPSKDATLIVRFRAYDARSLFFKELKQGGFLQLFDKEGAVMGLPKFIEKKAAMKGATFASREVLDLFLSRENYANRSDITLYNLLGDLNNLVALNKCITKELVCSVVPDNQKDNVFGIARQIVTGNITGLRTQAKLCWGKEIPTLAALLREYRIAYKALYFPLSEIGVTKNTFKELGKEQLMEGILLITAAIDAVKAKTRPQSVILEHTFLQLAFSYQQKNA